MLLNGVFLFVETSQIQRILICVCRMCLYFILCVQDLSAWKKIYILYNFIVKKIVAQIFPFIFYDVMILVSIMFPEVKIPLWCVQMYMFKYPSNYTSFSLPLQIQGGFI